MEGENWVGKSSGGPAGPTHGGTMCGTALWDAWAYLWKEHIPLVLFGSRWQGGLMAWCLYFVARNILWLALLSHYLALCYTEASQCGLRTVFPVHRGWTASCCFVVREHFYPGILTKRDLEPLVFFFFFELCICVWILGLTGVLFLCRGKQQ